MYTDDPPNSFEKNHPSRRWAILLPQIPGKSDKYGLEKNFLMAKGRLESLFTRIKKIPVLLAAYHQVIKQMQLQNFVKKAELDYGGLHTYLPHHPVIRQDKLTTKIRLVFDCTAKSKCGPNLNDVLETGLNLNLDLLVVLIAVAIQLNHMKRGYKKAFRYQIALILKTQKR